MEESLAAEPDQSRPSDVGERIALELDDREVRGDKGAGEASPEPAVRYPADGSEPTAPTPAENGRNPHGAGAEQSRSTPPKAAEVATSAPVTEPDLAGELKTIAATTSAAPETTPAAPAERPSLGDHSLMPLEAATELAESLGLGYHLGGAVERIASGASNGRAGVEALREASWLIERYIALIEQRPIGADLHAESVRLAHWGEAFAGLRAISRALEAGAGEDPTPTETEPSGAEAATQPGPALLTDREALSPPAATARRS